MAIQLHKLTYRLHVKERARLAQSLELRRNYLRSIYAQQRRVEMEHIQSHINRLQAGTRRLYLESRYRQLAD